MNILKDLESKSIIAEMEIFLKFNNLKRRCLICDKPLYSYPKQGEAKVEVCTCGYMEVL